MQIGELRMGAADANSQQLSGMTVKYTSVQCYGGIWRRNTEYNYNSKYSRTSIVILAKHWLWLPDDGLFKPNHVGAAFKILIALIF
jgi:hypothetical protein